MYEHSLRLPRSRWAVFSGVLFGTLVLAAGCGRAPRLPANTLIYGRGEDTKTLDPINAETGESVKVLLNLYDCLVTYADDSLELVPSLASSWSTSDDGLMWTFQLRPDVTFHDGTPLDASAVVFSLKRLIDDEHPHVHDPARPYRTNYQMIEAVRERDPLTVEMRLSAPSAVLLKNLAMFSASIVSPAAVREHGSGFATQPVGSGPFRFERWVRDQQLVLAAFDDHWRGRPQLDRVIFVPVSENATRVQQLLRGEIHLADNLPDVELDALREAPEIVINEGPAMNVAYLAMQMEKAPLHLLEVREAIWMAIDKAALIDRVYAGHAEPAVNMVPRNMWGHHDGVEDRPFDPQAARKLIEKAAAEHGFQLPLSLNLAVMREPRPYMQDPLRVASFVKDSLAEIGILVAVDAKPMIQHFERTMRGDHQLALAGWTSDNSDPDNFLYSLLDLDNINDHGNNLSRYRNLALHEILVAAQQELDEQRRLALYRAAQETIFSDAPCVPLVHTQQRVAQRSSLRGYQLHPATLQRVRLAHFEAVP